MRICNNQARIQNHPTFEKKFTLAPGANEVLIDTFAPDDWAEFSKLYTQNCLNEFVDISIWFKGTQKLGGRIIPRDVTFYTHKDYSQHFWNSTIGFIRKLVEKAEKLKTKMEKEPKAEYIDNILSKKTI